MYRIGRIHGFDYLPLDFLDQGFTPDGRAVVPVVVQHDKAFVLVTGYIELDIAQLDWLK